MLESSYQFQLFLSNHFIEPNDDLVKAVSVKSSSLSHK